MRRRLAMIVDLPNLLPWTTSLWTLQETALRMDAVFHDKAGLPISHQSTGNSITIRHFIRTLKAFERQIEVVTKEVIQVLGSNEDADLFIKSLRHNPSLHNELRDLLPMLDGAARAVKRTGLPDLLTTNSIELMQATTLRSCQRPQDRVYGIMGVMGVNVPVDYTEDPSVVMANFLAELHRQVPAEMQAFYRPAGDEEKVGSLWRVDETCHTFGLVQQLSPPEPNFVVGVTKQGDLVISYLLELGESGQEELITLSLAECIMITFDHRAVAQLTGVPIDHRVVHSSSCQICHLILSLSAKARLGLVFLGSIRGSQDLAWNYMYLMIGHLVHEREDEVWKACTRPFRDALIIVRSYQI
ncbi:hypothetical protein F4782DRAFT_536192 [Xylaria castorea]|nr:hypothetical protein F4782DRAFT_536192 [Xylaria castorea]